MGQTGICGVGHTVWGGKKLSWKVLYKSKEWMQRVYHIRYIRGKKMNKNKKTARNICGNEKIT